MEDNDGLLRAVRHLVSDRSKEKFCNWVTPTMYVNHVCMKESEFIWELSSIYLSLALSLSIHAYCQPPLYCIYGYKYLAG